LRGAGHEVRVVDQYDGRVFNDHDTASAYVADIGFPALMERALDAVADLPDGFVAAGFSNGGGMAEHVALHRNVAGVIMLSGTLPLRMLGAERWPGGLSAQIHYAIDDPLRVQDWVDSVAASVRAAGGQVDYFEYPGAGHLFTDPSLPDDYDPEATDLLFDRVVGYLRSLDLAAARPEGTAR
jgi:dienelactone hydrolase